MSNIPAADETAHHAPPRMTRRGFLNVTLASMAITVLPGVAGGYYSTQIEARNFQVEQVTMRPKRLPPAFDGFKLVHLSDIHVDRVLMDEEHLHKVADAVINESPDMVVFTGDFVTNEADKTITGLLKDALSRLADRFPCYSVPGNHDYWVDIDAVDGALRESGVVTVANRRESITRNGDTLYICGLDDVWEKKHRLHLVTREFDENRDQCAILLCHEPDFADTTAATGVFDVQLSGHAHGGQVVIPGLPPPILPWLGQIYHTGQYQIGDMIQYTTRGVGSVRPRVRFNCPPEITLITFQTS